MFQLATGQVRALDMSDCFDNFRPLFGVCKGVHIPLSEPWIPVRKSFEQLYDRLCANLVFKSVRL